jgi:hypothetical protein
MEEQDSVGPMSEALLYEQPGYSKVCMYETTDTTNVPLITRIVEAVSGSMGHAKLTIILRLCPS